MTRRSRAAAGAIGLLAALAAPAAAQLPLGGGTADLAVNANLRADGPFAEDNAGQSVAPLGDLNRDGRADFVVGVPHYDGPGTDSGAAFVVYGPATPTVFDLRSLGTAGYRIEGANARDQAGTAVANAGDVNRDGLVDIIIGAPLADDSGLDSGSAYVVFGRAGTSTISLNNLGSQGFRIEGAGPNDRTGTAVGPAGDVNGDQLADVAVGAPVAGANNRVFSGSAFVVFGRTSTSTIDLSTDAQTGRFYRIDGARPGDALGSAVTTVGDTTGDGRSDVAVGAPGDDTGDADAGAVYVVSGQASSLTIDVSGLGGAGYRYHASSRGELAGSALFPTDDLNGDGRADLLIGAPGASRNDRAESGSTYALYSPSAQGAGSLSSAPGYRIDGAAAGDRSGTSVAPTGDVSGDAISDVIVGAPGADNNGRGDSGSAYVVYGRSNVDLAALGTGGTRIDGGRTGDAAGAAVSGAGDLNGDRGFDVLVGAPRADNNNRINSGAIYSVFGYPPGSVPPPPVPPPTQPPPPANPSPFVSISTTRARASRGGTLVIRMRCNLARPERCRGTTRLSGRVSGRFTDSGDAETLNFGRALINLRYTSRGAAVVPLPRAARRALARARRVRVRATVTPRPGTSGAPATRTITLLAARR